MNGLARVRVNGFDFDAYAQSQGMIYDDEKEALKKAVMHHLIEYALALDVVLAGAWLIKKCYSMGDDWFRWAFAKFAPGFLLMVEYGQL